MKRLISVPALLLAVALTAGILMAQETKKDPPDQPKGYKALPQRSAEAIKAARDARTKRPDTRDSQRPGPRRDMLQRPDMGRPMMMRQRQIKGLETQRARKKHAFMQYSGELKAIRKIALKENAKKTVKYIDKLITRKEKEFETSVKDADDRIKKIRAQTEKQNKFQAERYQKMRGPGPTPPKPKPKTPDTKETGKKKDK